ncbi:DUF1534 domain-containing protein, partial [Pseudomonas syringae]|nr:DUF1534 domain-containing protein [Pseudomonas syringae]
MRLSFLTLQRGNAVG